MSEARIVRTADVDVETWSDPVRGDVSFRTLFGGATVTGDFTAGITDLAAGGWLGHHRHEPAELYYVVDGEGVVTLDGEEHLVGSGTAIYIPGGSEHGIRNFGEAPLRFFYTFAVGSFDEIEYRFTQS